MTTSIDVARPARQGRVLNVWTPEDKAFWEKEGEAIADTVDAPEPSTRVRRTSVKYIQMSETHTTP